MRTFSATKPPASRRQPSILVHGLTGAGKTTRSLQGGKPLVICTEPKSEAHVLNLNQGATCWVPESCADLERIFEWLGSPKLAEHGFTRIVLDSYTELTEALPNWILRKANPGIGLEIGRRIELQEYGSVQQWGLAVVRAIQLTGLPSIVIARSESKDVGRTRRILPAGLGSSVKGLPAQLVPTVEARWDQEMQAYIWDSRPDECSQRCGLPWVPAVWDGSADDFLAVVAGGHTVQASTPAIREVALQPAEPAAPAEPSPAWVDAIRAFSDAAAGAGMPTEARVEQVQAWMVLGEGAIEALRAATLELVAQATKIEAAAAQANEQRAQAFVDAVSPAIAKAEDVAELLDLAREHKVNTDALWAYFLTKKKAVKPGKDGSRNWNSLTAEACGVHVGQLKNPKNRQAFIAHLHQNYIPSKPQNAA